MSLRKRWREFLLRRVPVEERARLMRAEDGPTWKTLVDVLNSVDNWCTDSCPSGCKSNKCCDWQRLYTALQRQPG